MNASTLKNNLIAIFILFATLVNAQQQQDRFAVIENKLKELSRDNLGLNGKVELSVNGVSIQEFIRGLATANNLNVSIDAGLTTKVVNNFTNVTVTDVLLFLCRKYDLDISFVGNILSIKQYVAPPLPAAQYQRKPIQLSYDSTTNQLTLDLNNDSLSLVAKELTKESQKNVVFSSDLAGKMVSGYIQNMPFNAAMEKFAFANNLKVTPTEDNFYLLEKADAETSDNSNQKNNGKKGKGKNAAAASGITLEVTPDKLINIEATDVAIADILSAVSAELKNNYFLFVVPKGNTSLNIKNATYDEFLTKLFNTTDYTFKKDGEIYLIGDRTSEGLRITKVYQLKFRTVEKVIDFIPSELKKGIDIKTFSDQNSLILSGSERRIDELESFLKDIDKVVPVISIEVMILDINNSYAVATGIKAGLSTSVTPTAGTIFPNLNMTLSAPSINSVIDGINGVGIVNLGKVTPNFYVNLQLQEQNGNVKITSTPLLATLNGHEAKMSIAETRYYLQQNSNVIATQSTTVANAQQFIPLTADFTLSINPIVSGDEQITLQISVKQQSFTTQTPSPNGNGPYGSTTRNFESLIRVKNQEMIMLGGLEQGNKSENSSGVPLLSRIPIIKWFFSSRTKNKTEDKLTILVKPTVIY